MTGGIDTSLPVAILGPGLLGGSLAMAIRTVNPSAEVRIWARRDDAATEVRSRGIATLATTSIADAVDGAGFVILATPVETMASQAREIAASNIAPGCIVTDVGSVKASVVSDLDELLEGSRARFVGSHPMAGSEKSGIDAARSDLFANAPCIVTPSARSNTAAVDAVKAFWSALGCRVSLMQPDEHDRKVARISHLPHAMAVVTVLAALRSDPAAISCAGSGFRDTTRIASGDPGLWRGILLQNKAHVTAALREALSTTRELLEIIDGLDDEKLRLFLAEAKNLRDRLATGATAYGND